MMVTRAMNANKHVKYCLKTCLKLNKKGREDGFKCDRSNRMHLTCASCKRLFPDRRDTQPQECEK